MKKTILIIVMAALCSIFQAEAQFYSPSDKTIKMGETLPESFYQTNHQATNAKTGEKTSIQLQKFRTKLIILDFWATWCGPCIYSLGKLDSIKAIMNSNDFIVVPVTYQTQKEATPIFNKFKWNMTSIVGDTTLAQIFPHSGIPHQVWIKDGKVIAIPKWDYATAENIAKTIKGQKTNMVMNNEDKIIDPLKPLFVDGNGKTGKHYSNKYAIIARYLPNASSKRITFLQNGDTSILYAINQTVTQLFFDAYQQKIFPAFDYKGSNPTAIKWEISNELRERILKRPKQGVGADPIQDSAYYAWLSKNTYGYNLHFPEKIRKSEALYFMQQDLNRFFGLYFNIAAKIENTGAYKYAVIRLKGTKEQAEKLLKAKGTKPVKENNKNDRQDKNRHYRNSYYRQIPSWIAKGVHKAIPALNVYQILDSTGITANFRIDMDLPSTINDGKIEPIQKELSRYGLLLTFEDKPLPVLVIREKKVKPKTANELINQKKN